MSATITEPGLVHDLDEADYHADPVPETSLSVSGAKRILECPALFKWERDNPRTKRAFEFGKAAHAKVLGTGSQVAVIPAEALAKNGATNTNAAREFIAAAEAEGRVALKPDEAAVVDAMAEQLASHPLAGDLLTRSGTPEVSLFWRDEATKVMLRGRADWLTTWLDGRPCVVDYKTTARTADPARFGWEARDFNYHMQDSWYREGLDLLTGEPHLFLFIVQSKTAPYLVSVVELDADAREVGAQRNRVARATYLDCMTRDEWPGYPPVVHPVSLPYANYAPEGDAA